jgi:hypothetical protein
MSKRTWVVGVCALVSALGPALAVRAETEPPPAPAYPTTTVYATCLEGSKVQNAPIAEGEVVTWTKQRPYLNFASVAAAGCWYTDDDAASTAPLTWAGTVTGNLASLTLSVDDFVAADTWRAVPLELTLSLTIDDQLVVDGAAVMLPAKGTDLRNGGITKLAQVSVTDLADRFGSEAGPGAAVHTVSISFAGAGGVHNWAWGCVEAPSGLTFNPAVPAPVAVSAASAPAGAA